MATKGKTALYYSKNKAALAKKQKYNREYAAKPEAIAKRAELVKKNRKMFKAGTGKKGDNLDVSHQKNGGTKLESPKKNRGNSENTIGDRASRGVGAVKKKKINGK